MRDPRCTRLTAPENNPNRERVRDVLRRALDLSPEERRAFVEKNLPAGESLRDALALLDEADELDGFLESPVLPAEESFEPALPESIGPYRVKRILGWGSMGVVYLAEQKSPARLVALKVLRLDASTETMAKRFRKEGELLARLSHPGVASIFEAGVAKLGAGEQPYLAMQYIQGRSITSYAEEHGLDRRERVRLLARVARAVVHAHEHGVLHRDLKPENILVTESGDPFVLDFGVAHTAKGNEDELTLTATGQVVGTLAYMAPEQARGGELDERADLFALGAILYELLTGELPFDVRGRLPHEALRIVADGDWRPPTLHDPTLTGDILAILATALAPEPVRRYPDVASFASDLERWLSGERIQARPPSAFDELVRFIRRNRALAIAATLVLLALGGLLAWGIGTARDLHEQEGLARILADQQSLADLKDMVDSLWPTSTSTVPAFDRWLASAHRLLERVPDDREILAQWGARGIAGPGRSRGWDGLEWDASGFLDELVVFGENDVPEMETRRDVAAAMFTRTVEDRREEWDAVRERVASDPRFAGLRLPPQEGLVPLGPDPVSGLEEFALWNTGEVPGRDADGFLEPRAEDALVLVLIPGGTVEIGSPDALSGEATTHYLGPPVPIDLDPFLIGKFEFTQAQWVRAFGFNPSDWDVGSTVRGKDITGLNPVESLSWQQCMELLPRIGLVLPTEAQWERAARGKSSDACLVGPTWESLDGLVNWNTYDSSGQVPGVELEDDGHFCHMPVGSFPPNTYGLYDVLGNVWEYCRDVYKVDYHELPHRPGDGLVIAEPDGDQPKRGRGWADLPSRYNVFSRGMNRFDGRGPATGLRPARRLSLEESADSRRTAGASIESTR